MSAVSDVQQLDGEQCGGRRMEAGHGGGVDHLAVSLRSPVRRAACC